MEQFPKIGIVYLSYHSEPYFERALKAIQEMNYPKERIELIVVDNPHPEFGGSVEFIKSVVEANDVTPSSVLAPPSKPLATHGPLMKGEGIVTATSLTPLPYIRGETERGVFAGTNLPRVTILPQTTNLGFAGGNNVGIKKALELGCKYVYLHNQDGFIEKDCLEKLVAAMENDSTIGAAQSLIVLYPETNLINSAGNAYHYLGFGYCNLYRKPKLDFQFKPIEEVGYASGASLMMCADLFDQHGQLDEDFELYHEDLEYSLRLKLAGYKIVMVSDALFYHEYSFSRNKGKYYVMERNRLATLLMYYRWPTIMLLLPMLVIVDIGIFLFSSRQGWAREKLQAYWYWLQPAHWTKIFAKRKTIQARRKISDRTLLHNATAVIVFEDTKIENPILKYIANPCMRGYWWVVRRLIWW